MKCTNPECGAENPGKARFCMLCGQKIETASAVEEQCAYCGSYNRCGYKFCNECGKARKTPEGLCPKCGSQNAPGIKFCNEFGANLSGAEQISIVSASKPYANCQVGDHFFYGSYPQGQNGEVEPIEWRVLARESDRVLVIAEYGLDCKRYNEKFVDITWSKCTLRTWLNGEFINEAFTAEEQRNLMRVKLTNPNSHWDSSVSGGPDTEDQVFLLSYAEAEKYFSGDVGRCCKATAYAVEQEAWVLTEDEAKDIYHNVAYAGNCWWWLRSPGYYASSAACVYSYGGFCISNVYFDYGALRPAAFMAL